MKTHKAVLVLVFVFIQIFPLVAGEPKISPANTVRLATEQLFEVAKKNETTGKTYGMCECVPGYRCQLCTFGTHYRDGKVCKECPELPGLIIIAFIFAIFIMIAFVHWLDKKNFNLAFINIGWDYFQVVAMFTDADVNWPPILYEFYIFLSFSFST